VAETSGEVFLGQSGASYVCTDRSPFAFGRASVLWRAKNAYGDLVAVKVFRDEPTSGRGHSLLSEFLNELTVRKTLSHPHVLPILDFGTGRSHSDFPFVVMPFCSGGNLRTLMKRSDYMPLDRSCEILAQVASALDAAHRHGIIHGDLKPENILFNDVLTHAYLSDFGVAKYFPIEERVSTVFPRLGEAAPGSTAYMGPEQIENSVQSPRSDIYSLAVVAYELLSGALPFDTTVSSYQQMRSKIAGKLTPARAKNPVVPRYTSDALLWGLAVDRDKRPNSATEFVQALENPKRNFSIPGKSSWDSLDGTGRAAVIAAAIAAFGGCVAAALKILPELIKGKH
jgi:serine/threonine protein kinase